MTEPLPQDLDGPGHIAAWNACADDFIDLVSSLDDDEWAVLTGLPGWSVGDVVAHVSWLEMVLLGEQDQPHEPDWAVLPHVTSDFGRVTEVPVDLRRSWTREAVVAELREGRVRRGLALAEGPSDAQAPATGPFGPAPLARVLRMRTLDTWIHDLDIRRATGRPLALDTTGAQLTATALIESLPMTWGKKVGADAGEALVLSVTGPGITFEKAVLMGDDGRARLVSVDAVEESAATVHLTMPWPVFVSLMAGRESREALGASIEITGDPARAEGFLAAAVVTP